MKRIKAFFKTLFLFVWYLAKNGFDVQKAALDGESELALVNLKLAMGYRPRRPNRFRRMAFACLLLCLLLSACLGGGVSESVEMRKAREAQQMWEETLKLKEAAKDSAKAKTDSARASNRTSPFLFTPLFADTGYWSSVEVDTVDFVPPDTVFINFLPYVLDPATADSDTLVYELRLPLQRHYNRNGVEI